jgi:hypothetical protein
MHFSTWLWEQLDLPGRSGDLAKLCWADVNNGCGNIRFNAKDWLNHFEEKHEPSKDKLSSLLILSYQEYTLFVDKK